MLIDIAAHLESKNSISQKHEHFHLNFKPLYGKCPVIHYESNNIIASFEFNN
jgi:hypothetical protein